jgi:hypothetical protein
LSHWWLSDKDVTPEEAMILAGSIYGGCMVNISLDIYLQKDMQGIRASVSAVQFWKDNVPFGTTVGDQRSKFKRATNHLWHFFILSTDKHHIFKTVADLTLLRDFSITVSKKTSSCTLCN